MKTPTTTTTTTTTTTITTVSHLIRRIRIDGRTEGVLLRGGGIQCLIMVPYLSTSRFSCQGDLAHHGLIVLLGNTMGLLVGGEGRAQGRGGGLAW